MTYPFGMGVASSPCGGGHNAYHHPHSPVNASASCHCRQPCHCTQARTPSPPPVIAPASCCPKPPDLVAANLTTVTGKKAYSTSHVFRGPATGATVLSLISLLQQSQTGNPGVHSVDVDVRTTTTGVELQRGNGLDRLYAGGSRSWSGSDDSMGLLGSATEFSLTLLAGDEVVINWVEIKV